MVVVVVVVDGGGAFTATVPSGAKIYYELSAWGNNGSGQASIIFDGVTKDTISSTSSASKTGNFTTSKSATLRLGASGGGRGSGGGSITITKIVLNGVTCYLM